MAQLTEHVMINKWDDDINSAITSVGGNTENSSGLPDYAEIIRTQLVAKNSASGDCQDFLYINADGEKSNYPWDGEPTTSAKAPQAKVVADSIRALYDNMALTERFKVLLVDEFPTVEVDLSAIYLVNAKCCDDPSCTCTCSNNMYVGCYYIKAGKYLKRIDIPKFSINLDNLFYITRKEYKDGLIDYSKDIEKILSEKFGRYWDDEDFTLDKVIDEIVLDLNNQIDIKMQNYIKVNDIVPITNDELNEITNKLQ